MKWYQYLANVLAMIGIGLIIVIVFPFIVITAMVIAAIGDKK